MTQMVRYQGSLEAAGGTIESIRPYGPAGDGWSLLGLLVPQGHAVIDLSLVNAGTKALESSGVEIYIIGRGYRISIHDSYIITLHVVIGISSIRASRSRVDQK